MVQKKQILVVEDNELNRAMLCAILEEEYQVLEAGNGQEALDILQQWKGSVALILLDIMMPVMDGYTFLERIKSDKQLSLIPVIVMTQSDAEEDEVTALAHGATDFVPKPYRPQVLLHRVASLIKLRETAAMVNHFQYDRLTGLYSREFFYRKVRERLDENPDQNYLIICSNIENFKLFNDTFGRDAGDRLLKELAAMAQSMVDDAGFCGRLNADRFLCFETREAVQQRWQNLDRAVNQHFSARFKSTVMRWGIYEIKDRSVSVEQMCDRAMLAADSIKGQYNHYFAVYDDSLRAKLLRENAITEAMETALTGKQFTVYFQPKYSLNDSCMAGAEALVRWVHPEWGFMSPGEFIPLFEKNGFISKLDQYVWERTCAHLRDWKEKGYPLLPVSVNVSRADMYQSNLADTLLALTRKYGVDPAHLHLEITESAYTDNPTQIIGTVEQLRNHGFIIEMDDFGSGYSSLNMLSQMQLDILKLDMKFVQNEISKPAGKSILNDIITMAHRMNLNVVAEGVETRNQVKRLQAVGCDYVQGYFFAKPMPAGEFEELLEAWRLHAAHCAPEIRQRKENLPVLLVADEDAGYRETVRNAFEGQYHVLEASGGESALACIRAHGGDGISTVILSMTLPEEGAALVLESLRKEPAFWQIPVLSTIPNGEKMKHLPLALETDDFLCKCHPTFDLNRRVQRLAEFAALRRREITLQDEANHDPLTGLFNRRGLQAAVSSLRKEDMPLAVCLFDLDDLKKVNDTYGHEMGDRVLRSFAKLLRQQTRPNDIHCRYGGDEFMLVLTHMAGPEAAMKKGIEICEAFRTFMPADSIPSACSGGIILCGEDESLSAELIERADRALYRAKRENKGGCCLWSAETDG